MTQLQTIPSIEHLLQTAQAASLIERFGRSLTVEALRASTEGLRSRLKTGLAAGPVAVPGAAEDSSQRILSDAEQLLSAWAQPTLQGVINAAGVILHTNLGRAPLSRAAVRAMSEAAHGYSNLELDLESGGRGSRAVHVEGLLRRLLGVEAGLVVNNNAAAVLLALAALAKGKRVVIARSQLIEIGGGFRVPDVMKQSGAKLVEVGTTNKVRVSDYEEALDGAALLMRAHRSNFKLVGFVEEPRLDQIAPLARQMHVPVLDDLGSGALLDTARFGLAHEPTVQESLAAGADLVCFSGDKLLGGPQAGILVGRESLLVKLRKHPLARALRADKTCLAGTAATLLHYLKGEAEREVPIWRMIAEPVEEVRGRAERWAGALGAGSVIAGQTAVGGGSLPGESFPTFVLALSVSSPEGFLARLRAQTPPVIARIENDRILLDPRTVLVEEEPVLVEILRRLAGDLK